MSLGPKTALAWFDVCGWHYGWVVLACLLLGATAQAGIVNLVSQDRFVDVKGVPGIAEMRQQASNFGPFNQSVGEFGGATAYQNSTLALTPDGVRITAQGGTQNSITAPAGTPESFFQVTFDVNKTVEFNLEYIATGDRFGNSSTIATFSGPFGTRTLVSQQPPVLSGVLAPGTYHLQADALDTEATGYFLQLSAVPLPTAFWAAVTMLPAMLVAGFRRRQKSRACSGPAHATSR